MRIAFYDVYYQSKALAYGCTPNLDPKLRAVNMHSIDRICCVPMPMALNDWNRVLALACPVCETAMQISQMATHKR